MTSPIHLSQLTFRRWTSQKVDGILFYLHSKPKAEATLATHGMGMIHRINMKRWRDAKNERSIFWWGQKAIWIFSWQIGNVNSLWKQSIESSLCSDLFLASDLLFPRTLHSISLSCDATMYLQSYLLGCYLCGSPCNTYPDIFGPQQVFLKAAQNLSIQLKNRLARSCTIICSGLEETWNRRYLLCYRGLVLIQV